MYAGHVALALALRRVRNAPPLWLLVLAAQGPDWLEAVGALLLGGRGGERAAEVLHAAPVVALMGIGAGAALAWWRASPAAGWMVALAWCAHWPLDLVTGSKLVWPGGPRVGANLYGIPALDFAIEGGLLLVGWALWGPTVPGRFRVARLPVLGMLVGVLGLQTLVSLFVDARGTRYGLPVQLVLTPDPVVARVGESGATALVLGAPAQAGQLLPDRARIVYRTSDPNVATVDRAGVVQGVAPGVTWLVVAEGARVLDSVRVEIGPASSRETGGAAP